jgi:GR25 family glycosyltransferase involved in LPS biosynthesis
MTDLFDCVFVINLEQRNDRMERISDLLHLLNIKFERFNAVDKQVVEGLYKNLSNIHKISTITNAGYLACILSHLSVYRIALDRGYTKILILEDDIFIHKNVQNLLKQFLNSVPEDWDMLYLGYLPLSEDETYWSHNHFQKINSKTDNGMVFRAKGLWCTHSYAIKKEYMNEIIQYYNTSTLDKWLEIDRFLVKEQDKNFCTGENCRNIYGCIPALFGQVASMSDLTEGFYTVSNEEKFINSYLTPRHEFL